MAAKKCSRCKKLKDLELFGPDRRNSDRRQSACRECESGRTSVPASSRRPSGVRVSPLDDVLAAVDAVDPGLRVLLAGQIAVVKDFELMALEVREMPQHVGRRLDAFKQITDVLERRRREVEVASRRVELESELMGLIRSPGEVRRIGELER